MTSSTAIGGLAASLWLLQGASAHALAAAATPPQPKTPIAESAVSSVVVTSTASDVQTSIDRRSYSLGKDIQATTGSIADALRNLPSVQVDQQGVLTLRGDPNVTILVDGKPSGAFEGAGRADALQQLPADQIERVELITNPSAAFTPEGSGGIINLISKKSRGSGWTGSAYATAGSAGLKRLGASFGYNSKKLNVTGSVSGNYQHNKGATHELRSTLDPAAGGFRDHTTDLIGRNLTRSPSAKLTAGYAADRNDQLSGTLSYSRLLIYGYPFYRFEDDDISGALAAFQERQGKRRASKTDTGVSGGWRHSFAGEGHQLSIDLLQNDSRYADVTLFTTLRSVPRTAEPLELNRQGFDTRHSEFKTAYTRPIGKLAKLSAGYELKLDDNAYDATVARGAAVPQLTPVPSTTYDFRYRQTINAAYATFERPLGGLSAQLGLRLENAGLDVRELTSRLHNRPNDLGVFPTLHLTYKLDDQRKLSASYTERIQRPPPFLLNPFRVYVDPRTFQEGNANLRPQETQSFELGYERRKGQASYQATAYYRNNKGVFSPVLRDLGGGVVVIVYDNLSSSRTAGLELVANGKLSKALTYSANANLFWKEISAANLGVAGSRSTYGVGGRLNLDWQARRDDLLQLSLSLQGKQIVAQGVVRPITTLNLGWRHKLNDRVTATLSAQDLLNTNSFHRTFDTPTLHERYDYSPVSRALTLRLDYRFGGKGKPARDPGFEYESAGQAAP